MTESPTTQPGLDQALRAAARAATALAGSEPATRADWLRAIADELDAHRDELVVLAQEETHLPRPRLEGEVGRTTFQLRLTADAVVEGSWLEVAIDHADPNWPTGPRPDLRRVLRPLGPVLVVAASNFPFAFSVAGGDTASALGSGCPVLLKLHPGHPKLSDRTGELVLAALAKAGAPAGTFAMISSEADAQAALKDPRIKAGAFTGSIRGGRALFDIAAGRPDPVPFYGELGSVNPVFVLPSALRRQSETLSGYVSSYTLGVGQFCTKPGVLFAPHSQSVLDELAGLVGAVAPAQPLNDRIAQGFTGRLAELREQWQPVSEGAQTADGLTPSLFATTIDEALGDLDGLFEEAFGPASVVVSYEDPAELVAVARRLPGQLTATVHGDEDDPIAPELLNVLANHAGRVIWNGWPTGVSVTWAMQHGGGWPATTASVHTSDGPTALRRFVTPISYQDVPEALLPAAVRDDNPLGIWQRIDGKLTPPS